MIHPTEVVYPVLCSCGLSKLAATPAERDRVLSRHASTIRLQREARAQGYAWAARPLQAHIITIPGEAPRTLFTAEEATS